MKKEKLHLEYVFDKASKRVLWDHLSTPFGLSEWFADRVNENGKIYSFSWKNHSMDAALISVAPNESIRFRWLEDHDEEDYFEMKIHQNDLTGGVVLEITDFVEEADQEAMQNVWESQIKTLKRVLGI